MLDFELARLEWRLIDLVTVLSRLSFEQSAYFIAAYQAEYPLSLEERRFWPEVWEFYKLQGVVQYWYTYFEIGGSSRLAAARTRLEQAKWVEADQIKRLRLREIFEG